MCNETAAFPFKQQQNMALDPLMKRLHKILTPTAGKRLQIEQRIALRIGEPHSLRAGDLFDIPAGAKEAIWRRIVSRIGVLRTGSLLTQLREFLTLRGAKRQELSATMQARLASTPQPAYTSERFKWVAATVAAAIVITSSPAIFLTGTTVAVSHVILVPTAGTVEISHDGVEWLAINDEMVLEAGVSIRTAQGQASIVYRDDAVLRLDNATTVVTKDTSELLEPAPEVLPAFALQSGRIWVQGLLPNSVRGLTVALPSGAFTVHEGSVSANTTEEGTEISVWDRHADIVHQGTYILLVAGERSLLDGTEPTVTSIPALENEATWSTENLRKDAVHRRQIALQQKERRAASAGILPTSTLYPVKRIAEEVDVFLTFNAEDRVQKKLDLANERLNEAAAMLLTGAGSGADVSQSLAMYRTALLDLAAESGSHSTVAQFLIRQSLTEAIADVTALQPDDESYVLKKTVVETMAQLPEGTQMSEEELQAMFFVDSLLTLNDAVANGDATTLQQSWSQLRAYVAMVEEEDSAVPPALRKEAKALLERFATAVTENSDAVGAIDKSVLEEIAALVPGEDPVVYTSVLSEAQIAQLAEQIYDRIYSYRMPRSRLNQLQLELISVRDSIDEGSVLRGLHALLPAQSQLSDTVRREIARLRWQRAGETYVEQAPETATGTSL